MPKLLFDSGQSIEQLENHYWKTPDTSYPLVEKCQAYRKIPVDQLSIEQLRLLVGQDIGLPFLVPKALQQLTKNILAEGDLYAGDLLSAVLSINNGYWQEHPVIRKELLELLDNRKMQLEASNQSSSLRQLFQKIDAFVHA
jgi:hypothetical protein